VAVFAMCASGGRSFADSAHIAKSAMYPPPQARPRDLRNEAEMCPGINGLTNYAPIAHWPRGDWGWRNTRRCLPCVRPGGRSFADSAHIAKSAIVCATRSARATFWNEAGMCPGINGFTNYALIAHWSRGDWGGAHVGVFAICVRSGGRIRRGIRTHRKERECVRPPPGSAVRPSGTKPECVLESTASRITLPSRIGPRGDLGWRIHGGVCHVCVRRPIHRGSHTSQRARCMRPPQARAARPSGTKPECVLESMASRITLPSRIGPGETWGGAYMAVFAMCASGGRSFADSAHIAKSAMYAPPEAPTGCPTSGAS